MSNNDELKRPELSFNFKLKMALVSGIVIMTLIAFLSFVSIQGCPAYFLNFPMRSDDCDASNVLTMTIEITVAGTFAIILGLIFYEKQKGDSDLIIKLNRKQLEQKTELSRIDKKIDDVDFDNKRLNALRIIIRNFNTLKERLEIIQPNGKGPFRKIEDLEKIEYIVTKIEKIVDETSLSRDPEYTLPDKIHELLRDVRKITGKASKIGGGEKFLFTDEPDFVTVISKISSMESTLGGVQREIIKKGKKDNANTIQEYDND